MDIRVKSKTEWIFEWPDYFLCFDYSVCFCPIMGVIFTFVLQLALRRQKH